MNFKVVERLHIVAVAGTYIRVMVIAFPLRSGRDIINRGFFFRKAVQNTRAVQNRALVNNASDSIPQTLSCILYLRIICRSQSGIRLMIAVFIGVVIVCFGQDIVRDCRPLLRKFGILDHLLQNLLLCARQIVGVRGIKDLPVVFCRHGCPGCWGQHPYTHRHRQQAAQTSPSYHLLFTHTIFLLFCVSVPARPWKTARYGSSPHHRSGQKCRSSPRCSTPAGRKVTGIGIYPDRASYPAAGGCRRRNRPAERGRSAA